MRGWSFTRHLLRKSRPPTRRPASSSLLLFRRTLGRRRFLVLEREVIVYTQPNLSKHHILQSPPVVEGRVGIRTRIQEFLVFRPYAVKEQVEIDRDPVIEQILGPELCVGAVTPPFQLFVVVA